MNDVDLSGMLADASASGAYYVDEGGRDSLLEAARNLEFACAAIDMSGQADKEAVLARIAAALRFPEWFGGNWDALSDSLNDLSWWPAEGYVLLLEHSHDWQQADPAGFDVLLEICNDAATAWAEHGVPFWLLVAVPRGRLAIE